MPCRYELMYCRPSHLLCLAGMQLMYCRPSHLLCLAGMQLMYCWPSHLLCLAGMQLMYCRPSHLLCLAGMQLMYCHSLSLASEKSRLVLPFWYRPTRLVPDKGPLNMCVCGIVAGDWRFELVGAYDERPGDKHGLCRTYQRVHRNWQRGITRYISLLFADDVR